jgi:hypothetical protein
MLDLFGQPVVSLPRPSMDKPKAGQPKGYAAPPGSGPKGETCGTCQHAVRVNGGRKDYWKCSLLRNRWTSSYGTDIRLKWASCRHWELQKLSPFRSI